MCGIQALELTNWLTCSGMFVARRYIPRDIFSLHQHQSVPTSFRVVLQCMCVMSLKLHNDSYKTELFSWFCLSQIFFFSCTSECNSLDNKKNVGWGLGSVHWMLIGFWDVSVALKKESSQIVEGHVTVFTGRLRIDTLIKHYGVKKRKKEEHTWIKHSQ